MKILKRTILICIVSIPVALAVLTSCGNKMEPAPPINTFPLPIHPVGPIERPEADDDKPKEENPKVILNVFK